MNIEIKQGVLGLAQSGEPLAEPGQRLGLDCVMRPVALLLALDQARLSENLQMLGCRRLGYPQVRSERADAEAMRLKQLDHAQAGLVGQGLQCGQDVFIGHS